MSRLPISLYIPDSIQYFNTSIQLAPFPTIKIFLFFNPIFENLLYFITSPVKFESHGISLGTE